MAFPLSAPESEAGGAGTLRAGIQGNPEAPDDVAAAACVFDDGLRSAAGARLTEPVLIPAPFPSALLVAPNPVPKRDRMASCGSCFGLPGSVSAVDCDGSSARDVPSSAASPGCSTRGAMNICIRFKKGSAAAEEEDDDDPASTEAACTPSGLGAEPERWPLARSPPPARCAGS